LCHNDKAVIMNIQYQMSFRTNIRHAKATQRLLDCLRQLEIKQWGYDFKELMLTLRTEFPDFKRIQKAITSAGYKCDLVEMEALENATNS
jgi:tRNA G26 N,N-dimethylase Trm1